MNGTGIGKYTCGERERRQTTANSCEQGSSEEVSLERRMEREVDSEGPVWVGVLADVGRSEKERW